MPTHLSAPPMCSKNTAVTSNNSFLTTLNSKHSFSHLSPLRQWALWGHIPTFKKSGLIGLKKKCVWKDICFRSFKEYLLLWGKCYGISLCHETSFRLKCQPIFWCSNVQKEPVFHANLLFIHYLLFSCYIQIEGF